MTIDQTTQESLFREFYSLHCSIRDIDKRTVSKADAKVREFITQFGSSFPETGEELFDDYLQNHITQLIQTEGNESTIVDKIKSFESVIIYTLSKSMPDAQIHSMVYDHDRFTDKLLRFFSDKEGSLEDLQRILDRDQIDINACATSGIIRQVCKKSLSSDSCQILEFLFKNGLTLNSEDTTVLFRAFTDSIKSKKSLLTDDLIGLMIAQGFDINISIDKTSLLSIAMQSGNDKIMPTLIFHGAELDEHFQSTAKSIEYQVLKEKTESILKDLLTVKEDVLKVMQKPKDFLIAKFSPAEMRTFVKQCYEKHLFRDVFRVYSFIRDNLKLCFNLEPAVFRVISPIVPPQQLLKSISKPETNEKIIKYYQQFIPDLENRLKIHDAFIQACLDGKFDVASGMLKEGNIDLRVCYAAKRTHLGKEKVFFPYCHLLNHACLSQDTKLIEFLIKAGCDVNDWASSLTWKPALLETVLYMPPGPKKNEIMDMLKAAGADINTNFHYAHDNLVDTLINIILNQTKAQSPEILESLFYSGINIKTIQIIFENPLWGYPTPGPNEQQLLQAMIYYGVDPNAKVRGDGPLGVDPSEIDKPREKDKHQFIHEALERRNKVIAAFLKEKLANLPELTRFSLDVLGEISSYIDEVSPQERFEIYKRCKQA